MYASNQPNPTKFQILESIIEWELNVKLGNRKYGQALLRDKASWVNRLESDLRRLPYFRGVTEQRNAMFPEIFLHATCMLKGSEGNAEGVAKDIIHIFRTRTFTKFPTEMVFDGADHGFDVYISSFDKYDGIFSCHLQFRFAV